MRETIGELSPALICPFLNRATVFSDFLASVALWDLVSLCAECVAPAVIYGNEWGNTRKQVEMQVKFKTMKCVLHPNLENDLQSRREQSGRVGTTISLWIARELWGWDPVWEMLLFIIR